MVLKKPNSFEKSGLLFDRKLMSCKGTGPEKSPPSFLYFENFHPASLCPGSSP